MKIVFISLGWIFVAVGLIGAFVPILPTTPFLLLAAFFFARGSQKFHERLTQSAFYKKHVESTIKDGQMPIRTKVRIVATAYTMLLIPLILTDQPIVRIVIGCSMIVIMITFTIFIKNKPIR
ncbi:MAG: YbaN family protein [Erysipelotrichaceae bacterium]|nr:YbaN family protein [Erysipelotrichaceae bacterium]MDP3305005.1 YbaN family protein [Erysipelotrichaceae bacterium]